MKTIREQIKRLPQTFGVYLWQDAQGKVLYAGKARNLKKRIADYLKKEALAPDKQILMQKAKKLDYIVCESEAETLILENNLIKKHKPPFNVVFKDDKNYLFIKIPQKPFPRIYTVRKILPDGAKYFGPYTSSSAVRQTLSSLQKIFPHRLCDLDLSRQNYKKPCLYYHIKRCLGPCINKITQKDYDKIINQTILFLQGKYKPLLKEWQRKMLKASKKQHYEEAAVFRNQIQNLEKIIEKQRALTAQPLNLDVINFVQEKNLCGVNLFVVREGKLLDKKNFLLKNPSSNALEAQQAFLENYYQTTQDPPKEIALPFKLLNEKVLRLLIKRKTKITIPKKGIKKRLLSLAQINAQEFLTRQRFALKKEEKSQESLAKFLKLPKPPQRIEAYDISDIQGKAAAGSMIVFYKGEPVKNQYRKFRIKKYTSPNDPGMMEEVLERRLAPPRRKEWPLPHLIILDGGKGQLSAGMKVLKKYKLSIPICALAKKKEEIYLPSKKESLLLARKSAALHLIQRMRDESHRFAKKYFVSLSQVKLKESFLDRIAGIGPKTKKKLLQKFGSVSALRKANLDELEKIVGKKLAAKIFEQL